MNDPTPLDPLDESLLIDAIQGELDPAQARALEARLARDPALARAHDAWTVLARAERAAFEPSGPAARAEAVRVAAWVRDVTRRDEAARASRERARPTRARAWSRVLAWSVAAHVVVLGVLAFLLRGEAPTTGAGGASVDLVGSAFDAEDLGDDLELGRNIAYYEDLVHRDLGAGFDELAMIEQEDLAELPEDLERLLQSEPVAWGERTHPVGVVVPMTRRRVEGLKRRRLRLLGYNEAGTIAAVDKGLGFLAYRQAADGSFPAPEGGASAQPTALALMAFLGEGHSSQGERPRDEVVRKGVQYLRTRAFGNGTVATVRDAAALAPVTIALSEDYMLSYGALTLPEAERRAGEIGALAQRVRAALDAPQASEDARTWLLWALDATQRTGVVAQTREERAAFLGWAASTAAADAGGAARSVEEALRAGTALLYVERGAEKPRFTSWSRANVESLVDRFDPRGGVRSADPIGDTARVLLTLQVAYRTY